MKQLVLIALLSISFSTAAQNDKATIKEKAVELANATVNSDWDILAKYTYPKIIELMGGIDQMVSIMETMMKQEQMKFISADIGDPGDIYKTGEDNLFSLVPQTLVIEIPQGKIKTEGYMLAISENNGERWYFLDTNQLSMDNVQQMLPNYNMDLVIPAQKQPIFMEE